MTPDTFTNALLDWFETNRRDLPWRRTYDPYHVWVSEIMAQQTQMDRVVPYFERWVERFPDVHALSLAREDEVLKLWEGLGYYSRARNLLRAAREIVESHDARFPDDPAAIRALPGIGEYTAGAIASIAFNRPVPCIDANVMRVFARLENLGFEAGSRELREKAAQCVLRFMPKDRPREFNQALMELGALVCSRKAECDLCPVQPCCSAHRENIVFERPLPKPGKNVIHIEMATGVLVHEGQVLIQKRKPDDVWPGLWEFPGGCVEPGETPEQALRREYLEETELAVEPGEKLAVVKYAYTKYRVTMHCYLCKAAGSVAPVFHEAVEGRFVRPRELSNYAYPAGHRKLLERIHDDLRLSALINL